MKSDEWKKEAISLYESGLTVAETVLKLKQRFGVSKAKVVTFLRQSNVIRTHAEQQRLKRWNLKCRTCEKQFLGRTPTVSMCDTCFGDSTPGVTSKKLQAYAKARKDKLLLAQFGLDINQRNELLMSQNNKCGLCEKHLNVPCLDHSHISGNVRGYLCHKCNLLLGQIENSGCKRWLENAKQWLGR